MKTINVVAAIIRQQQGDTVKLFSTQRGYGDFKGGWEFPGGKIEPGETPEQALVREIQEELNVTVRVGKVVDTVEYDYPTFHLSMPCFLCEFAEDAVHLELREHDAAKWLTREEMDSVAWLPADQGVVQKLKEDDRVWEIIY